MNKKIYLTSTIVALFLSTSIITSCYARKTLLFSACEHGFLMVTKALSLYPGLDINSLNKEEQSLLYIASANGHKSIVAFLLKKGALMTKKNQLSPLWIAAFHGHDDIVKMLIKDKSDLNNYADDGGAASIHVASQNGHLKVINSLIEAGDNVNKVTTSGASPLFLAAQNGQEETVELLIKKGANVNQKKYDGTSPLWAASYLGLENIVSLLVKSDADINSRNRVGIAPIEAACLKRRYGMVRYLKSAGAIINKKTIKLHCADYEKILSN